VAPALALAEPEDAPHERLNEGSPADGLAVSHQLCTTTRDVTVFSLRDPLAIPQLPFMHNVEVSGVPKARPLDRRVGQRPAASTPACQTTTTVPTASAACKTGTGHGR
jgi:hypothetical protein